VAKTTARPVITMATAGAGNPVVSTAEDVVAAVTSLLSVLMPIVALVLIVAGVLLIIRALQRRRVQA
jgi:hypothetical protein